MNIRFRKPELVPTMATLFVVAVTMYLGVWQLQRLEWKNKLLAGIEQAQSEAPRPLLSYTPEDMEKAEWHNVFAAGVLLHRKEIHMTPRFNNGILGYGVLTPLAITSKFGTQYVLVNRGWVAPENIDPATRAEGNPLSRVLVEGAIRSRLTAGGGFIPGKFTPDNNPDKNLWYWYDMPALSRMLELPLLPVIIDATAILNPDRTKVTGGPVPFPIEINIRNDHKGYAITWFLIGLSAVGVYLAYYMEKKS